jgi:hypothetical protein
MIPPLFPPISWLYVHCAAVISQRMHAAAVVSPRNDLLFRAHAIAAASATSAQGLEKDKSWRFA